jgi:cyclopropane fatty-acyl-phospholipid synthase-like methyltransferase
MHDWALGPGAEMVRHLDLTGRRRLLDVGAGSGAYSMLLAERYPALEAVCFDLPGVVPIAAELISARGLQDRVTTRSGSYLTDDFGSGFDVVLLSNMLHQEDAQVVKSILRKAAAALVDGGQLVIQAAFLGGRQAAQTWAALQSLQLSLFYEGGRNYSQEEMLRLVRETGFSDARVKRMSLINSDSLILATKERKTTP